MKGDKKIIGLGKLKNAATGVEFDYGAALAAGTYIADYAGGSCFSVTAPTGNLTIQVRNLKPGDEGGFDFKQDGAGGKTLTWDVASATAGQAAVSAATAGGLAVAAAADTYTFFTLRGVAQDCTAARIVGRAIV